MAGAARKGAAVTDIFVAYARQDRETVRRVVGALQAEGWDVWCDPAEPRSEADEVLDSKLSSAGAVLVIWSFNARYADHVRSEAAAGLYRDRLVQTRIDAVSPPRPFDQVEVVDLGVWGGGREDIIWQSLLSAVRRTAGPPGRAPTRPVPARLPSRLSSQRRPMLAPLLALIVLAGAGALMWVFDPLGWRNLENATPTRAATVETGNEASARPSDSTRPSSLRPNHDNASADPVPVDGPRSSAGVVELEANPLGADADESGSSADALAQRSLQLADDNAWAGAMRTGTPAAYAAYLDTWPAGRHVADARAAMLLPAASQSREPQLPANVLASVTAAREAAAQADRQATLARARAAESDRAAQAAAESASGSARAEAQGGVVYAGQVRDGGFTGPGVRSGPAGDVVRYRGDLRRGVAEGVGVVEFAESSGAQRYEGEIAGDRPSGAGVTTWTNGNRYAGTPARGVLTYGDGRRYEGDLRDGAPEGAGALWSADGALLHAGTWSRGQPLR